MKTRIRIKRRDKSLNQHIFFRLMDDFINDSFAGRRTKKNGSSIGHGTIKNYEYLKKALERFKTKSTFEIKLPIHGNLTTNERDRAKKYWMKFYNKFTSFLYKDLNHYDNYVGTLIKSLRTFFTYLNEDRNIDVGYYYKLFYVPCEKIPIISLDPSHLNYMIYNKGFAEKVKAHNLEVIRDIFVFGCSVALRISDLMQLSRKNLIIKNQVYYLTVKSQKTRTNTSIKLPDYCVDIIKRYKGKYPTLLPISTKAWVNIYLKKLGRLLPDNFELVKTREKRGKARTIYKDPVKRTHYKLADHMTAHTMRRTAITTMLSLGMPEHVVRKISGHAPNSAEFFRYVEISQPYIDKETDLIFEKIRYLEG